MLISHTGGHLSFHPHHLAVTYCKLSFSAQHLCGLRGRSINKVSERFGLIGGRLQKGGQHVLSSEAKLKRGLVEAALTTEQLGDTNIYAEKPHTHTDADVLGYTVF